MPAVQPDPPVPEATETLPPPLFGVLVVAGLVVTAAGLKQASDIVGPLFLTLTIVIAVFPMNGWLLSRKVPQWLASLITMITVYLLIIVVMFVFINLVVDLLYLAANPRMRGAH